MLLSIFLSVAIISLFMIYISSFLIPININYAYGHALPVSYSPEPNSIINRTDMIPSKVTISFSERPDPKVSSIEVLNSNNQRVDNNDFKITGQQNNRQASISLDKNKLTEGIYTVSWLTMSADDGHIAKGSYIFGIENVGSTTSSSPPSSSLITSSKGNNKFSLLSQQNQIKTEAITSDVDGLIKWPLIVAQSAIVGSIISHLFLWTNNRFINRILVSANKDKPISIKYDHRNIKPNKSSDDDKDTNSINATRFKPLKVFVLVLCLCSISVFICGTALMFLQVIDLSTSTSNYLSIFISLLDGSAGQVWMIRSVTSLIVIVTSLLYFYTEKKKVKSEINERYGNLKIENNNSNPRIKRNPFVFFLFIALAAGAVGIFANSMTSHSSAVTFLPSLAISLDWLHFMAVSIWVGGLFYISTVLLTLAKSNILVDSIKIKTKPNDLSKTTPNSLSSASKILKNNNEHQPTLSDGDPFSTSNTSINKNFSPITKGDYFLALLLPRFSLLATISLGIIGVSGLYMAWIHLHSFDALFDSQYGITLIVKLLTILPVVVLGSYHQLILHNYMINLSFITKKRGDVKEEEISYKEKKELGLLSNKIKMINNRITKGGGEIKSNEVYTKFSKTIKIESLLAIVVLFFASILTITSPPASMNMPSMMTMMGGMGGSSSNTVTMTSNNMNTNTMNHDQPPSIPSPQATKNPDNNTTGQRQENSSYTNDVKIMDTNTKLQINPFYAGFNTFKLTFTGADGKPAKDVSNVILQFTNDEADIGPIVVTLNKISDGTYSTFGGYLSQKGNWTIQLTAQRVNAYDLNNEFDVTVKQKPLLSPVSSLSSLSNISSTSTATGNTNTMNQPESAPSFDSFAILAIILSGLVIFGSAYYFKKSKQQLQQTLKMFETEYKE
jgi:putative copper export protein/methionine-rich copper-binding protein CopC